MAWVIGLLAVAVVLTAPRWLPARVVSLRAKVFEKVNGDSAITFPNAQVGPERFQELYSHPAANGRSKGAGLSTCSGTRLSPGPEVHQEHLEAARATTTWPARRAPSSRDPRKPCPPRPGTAPHACWTRC
ncbi:hypothetical protein [Lentzea indica]|uniref:hypothetical protein n=1 Tax=Lentzea indica TaxID=2604800 RepID=UPI001FE4294C|nr:hypothetical protein [Lentzea indica]